MRRIPWRHRLLRATAALGSGVAALAGSYAVVGESSTFVAAPIANLTVRLAPGALVTFAITVLGDLGSQLAYVSGLAAAAVLFGAVAEAGRVGATRLGRPVATPAAVAAAVGLVGVGFVGPVGVGSAVGAAVGAALAAVAVERGVDRWVDLETPSVGCEPAVDRK